MPDNVAAPDAKEFKSGFVALVGRPNAGKSTLTNALVGRKIAITSDTPQTTRHRLRAIVNRENSQIVFVDTPGLHKPHDALGDEVNQSTFKALEDVDVIAFLVDSTQPIGRGDEWVAEYVKKSRSALARILVLTKVDISSEEQVQAQIDRVKKLGDFDRIIALSAKTDFNLEGLLAEIERHLPCGPRWFPEDMDTDQSIEVMISEFIREKVLYSTFDEVPHAVGVQLDDLEQNKKADITKIYATIYVERDSQKGIIIGKGGSGIKKIGETSRADLERLLGTRVFLDLRVKVKKGWRKDASQIKRFGYGEGL
ncbi:MAG: GTPase Era [Coriobacteriia bacterium]|nr:GTPase Era [Coriobacteriia bacterium]